MWVQDLPDWLLQTSGELANTMGTTMSEERKKPKK